jgi:hypothetical protein
MKEIEMERACSTHGEMLYEYILLENPQDKRERGRPRRRWKDTFKMDLKFIGSEGVD